MSKAFTKESDAEGDEHDHAAEEAAHAQLVGGKNWALALPETALTGVRLLGPWVEHTRSGGYADGRNFFLGAV
jgi:hypothetical protein